MANRLWHLAEETLSDIRAVSSRLSECRFDIDAYVAENDYRG
ncbi:hypothetical protein [Streptomyces hypolithicus]